MNIIKNIIRKIYKSYINISDYYTVDHYRYTVQALNGSDYSAVRGDGGKAAGGSRRYRACVPLTILLISALALAPAKLPFVLHSVISGRMLVPV